MLIVRMVQNPLAIDAALKREDPFMMLQVELE